MQPLFPFLQTNSAVITLCSLTVAIISLWLTSKRAHRSFSCKVVVDTPIFPDMPEEAFSDRLGKDRIVIPPGYGAIGRTIEVELRNTGSQAITPTDLHEPIGIQLPEAIIPQEPMVSYTFPDTFKPQIEVKGSTITMVPALMNARDCFRIRFTIASPDYLTVKTLGRVKDVPQIGLRYPAATRQGVVVTTLLLVITAGFSIVLVGFIEAALEHLPRIARVPPLPWYVYYIPFSIFWIVLLFSDRIEKFKKKRTQTKS